MLVLVLVPLDMLVCLVLVVGVLIAFDVLGDFVAGRRPVVAVAG